MDLRRVSIEAGGNSPFIVFGDANIDDAVEGQRAFTGLETISKPTVTQELSHPSSAGAVRLVSVRIGFTSTRPSTPSLHVAWPRKSRLSRLEMVFRVMCMYPSQ